MRTPHLRTNLSAAEVAAAAREAAELIETLNLQVENGLSRIRSRNDDIKRLESDIAKLNEQVLQQARTIECYQRKYPEGV